MEKCLDMDDDEILVEKSPVYLYNIPPRLQKREGYLHRASDWDVGNPDWTGKIALVAAGPGCCHLQLEDNTGDIFAQAVIESFPTPIVQAVIDSKRFFVLKIQKKSGDFELAGIGYSTRDDSRDFIDILEEYFSKPVPVAPQKRPASPTKIVYLQPSAKKVKADDGNSGLRKVDPGDGKSSSGSAAAVTAKRQISETLSNEKSGMAGTAKVQGEPKKQASKDKEPVTRREHSAEITKKTEVLVTGHSDSTERKTNKSQAAKTDKNETVKPKSILKSQTTSAVALEERSLKASTASSAQSAKSDNTSEPEKVASNGSSGGDLEMSKENHNQHPRIHDSESNTANKEHEQKNNPASLTISKTDAEPSSENILTINETSPNGVENVTEVEKNENPEIEAADKKMLVMEELVLGRSDKVPKLLETIVDEKEPISKSSNFSGEESRIGLETQVSFDILDTGEDEMDAADLSTLEATIDPLAADCVSFVDDGGVIGTNSNSEESTVNTAEQTDAPIATAEETEAKISEQSAQQAGVGLEMETGTDDSTVDEGVEELEDYSEANDDNNQNTDQEQEEYMDAENESAVNKETGEEAVENEETGEETVEDEEDGEEAVENEEAGEEAVEDEEDGEEAVENEVAGEEAVEEEEDEEEAVEDEEDGEEAVENEEIGEEAVEDEEDGEEAVEDEEDGEEAVENEETEEEAVENEEGGEEAVENEEAGEEDENEGGHKQQGENELDRQPEDEVEDTKPEQDEDCKDKVKHEELDIDNGSHEEKPAMPALSLPKGYKFQTEVGGLFKCHKCPETFGAYNLIKRHWTLVHGFRNPAHCVICLLPFPSRMECAAHRKNAHGFKCEDCGKEFKKEVGLRDHEKSAHAKVVGNSWDCPHCSKKTSFKLKFQLIKHIQSQHENLTGIVLLHLCLVCKEKFLNESDLSEHAVKHENPLACTLCEEKFFGPRGRAKAAVANHMKECHPNAPSYPEGRRNSTRRRGTN